MKLKKLAALGMSFIMTCSVFTMSGAGGGNAYAAYPTTDGHDKYVDSNVFNVIGSDDFGTKELSEPLYNKAVGSSDITRLQVPTLAFDDTSIGLVWEKPEKYDNIADYNVYINGELAGTARQNYAENSVWADIYMKSFYDYYKTASDVKMVNVDIHCYRAVNLKPDTTYTFKVVAIDANGKELGTPQTITQKTSKAPDTINVRDYGVVETEGYTTYDDEKNQIILKNTAAIQKAIDECPKGGKVVIPENTDGKVYVVGALWLKSDMTLELNGTLWASPNSDHFEIGFLMYPFYTDTRSWGLLNATSADEKHPVTNLRITGNGKVYGNGWKFGKKTTVYGDGYTTNKGMNPQAGDPSDVSAWGLPQFCGASGNGSRFFLGIQAKDSTWKYLKNTGKYTEEQLNSLLNVKTLDEANQAADAVAKAVPSFSTDIKNGYSTRSSLVILRNCENVYVGDVTVENPSFHSVNILDSRNVSVNNVKVFSYDANNGDGIGLGCSQNVVCWGNFTDSGDDNINFAASVGEGARDCEIQSNSECWIFNNFLREGHGGLAAGSHTGNGIQDILFEDTVMNHIDMAFRFKSAPINGGFGANITMRDCAVADTNQGWVLTTSYSDGGTASAYEYGEIGEFYNFSSYNISVYGANQNTVQVLADVDPISNPQKPLHSHHNLYFQDITFGNVGSNGKYKNKNGWETLIGCENAVFYNFKIISYNKKALDAKTNTAFNNMQYCKNIVFQGTTWDSLGACTDKMKAVMSGIKVLDHTVTAKVNGGKTEEPFTYGDVNNDTFINSQDAVILKKVCAGMAIEYNEKAADVDCSGKVDVQDAVLLLKHLAGMNVELGKKDADVTEPKPETKDRSVNLTWNKVDNDTEVFYGIDTYVDGKKVDMLDGIKETEAVISRLSAGVEYTFKVYVSEKGDSANSMDLTGNNKTLLGECKVKVDGDKDTEAISVSGEPSVALSSAVYTHALAKWTGLAKEDARIRGYHIYANGVLVDTIYNYQIKNKTEATEISQQVGRLTAGINNKVQITAFTDAGIEYKFPEASIETLGKYDFKAPVWPENAKLSATVSDSEVVLSWDAATDDTAVNGYRVYVDGQQVGNEVYFNPVNAAYTTKETTYTIKDLDLSKDHTFTVQAGDTWWRAATTMGSYDKMACYNWTNEGLSTSIEGVETEPMWHAIAFGQSTDVFFSSNVLPEKIGTNYVWPINEAKKDKTTALTDKGLPVQDVSIESRGGKLAVSHEGLVYYYTELPVNKNFVLTADVTVTQCGPEVAGVKANAQEGAGLMVRDVNGDARKDPEVPGYSEYPAASNDVLFYYAASSKAINPKLNLNINAKFGIDNRFGDTYNAGRYNKTVQKQVITGDGTGYATTQKLRMEKTDTSFICYYLDAEGNVISKVNVTEENKNAAPNMLTQLDSEKYTVGFFCSRNMAMNVENIDLQTSEVVNKDTTPYYTVTRTEQASIKLSSPTLTNGEDYTLAFLPTHSGKATIKQDGTVIADSVDVVTWKQFTLDTKITGTTSTYEIEYTADKEEDGEPAVTNAGEVQKTSVTVTKETYNKDLYVSPDGTGTGTQEDPMSVAEAVKRLVPGGTIYMLAGEYTSDIKITREMSGTEQAKKSLIASDGVVLMGKQLNVSGDYWNVTGIEVNGNKVVANPIVITGNYNTFYQCVTHHGNDTGFYIKGSGHNLKQDIVPSYNLIKNCESYENRDASGINADGFAAKLGIGEGNRFESCVSHDNADDGWDLFNKLGENYNGRTTISHCIAYNNGNNGFKLGGEGRLVANTLEYSIAYNNNLYGITDNFNPGEITVTNNICFNNKCRNVSISESPYKPNAIVKNNISYKSEFDEQMHQDDAAYAAVDENNYFIKDAKNPVSESKFVSLDVSKVYTLDSERNIILGDFMKPVAGEMAGAGVYVTE